MKIKKDFFLPENKNHLLWVLLFLVTILLIQTILYPKIQKIETYKTLTKNYRKELSEMNNKIAESMVKKNEMEKIKTNIEQKFYYKGNIITLLQKNIINKMPSSFNVLTLYTEKTIISNETQLIPITIEFSSTINDLSVFLDKLSSLQAPVEIVAMKIDGLSPTVISVKIQMIFEKRNNL